jgi:DNA-binding CsgD family transcriptional regulator
MVLRDLPTAADVMKILGAVYDVGQAKDTWLTGVLRTVSSTLDQGAGVAGVLYDISENRLRTDVMEGINIPVGWHEAGLSMHQDPRFIPRIIAGYRSILCATLSEQVPDPGLFGTIQRDYYERHAMGEQISINGIDCSGKGCALYLFSRGSLALSDTERDLFSRLATHLATAYRLQRQLAGDAQASSVGVEAVLTPGGQVAHAEAKAKSVEARQELKLAVRQRERARESAARDAERVVRSLKGLVSARWTLVDHYESGGKRYVLARENAPKPTVPARLSDRERQVVALAALGRSNKLIAYELGLAYSTVRVLMARACVKLGTTSRSELIARQRSASRGHPE